jgi:hypothetical protein
LQQASVWDGKYDILAEPEYVQAVDRLAEAVAKYNGQYAPLPPDAGQQFRDLLAAKIIELRADPLWPCFKKAPRVARENLEERIDSILGSRGLLISTARIRDDALESYMSPYLLAMRPGQHRLEQLAENIIFSLGSKETHDLLVPGAGMSVHYSSSQPLFHWPFHAILNYWGGSPDDIKAAWPFNNTETARNIREKHQLKGHKFYLP